ncbi:MAG: DUF975 family protein [Ruminococcaceae bacterium]|nr:DUF975 family protein [Oscillospiraceae bacterium]
MTQNDQTNGESIFFPPQKKNASYYRREARARLAGKWKTGFLVSFLAILLGGASAGLSFSTNIDTEDLEALESFDLSLFMPMLPLFIFIGVFAILTNVAFDLFVSGPTEVGYHRFHLEVIDRNDAAVSVSTLFGSFREHYLKAVLLRLLRSAIGLLVSLPLLAATAIGLTHLVTAFLLPHTLETLLWSLITSSLIMLGGGAVTALIAFPVQYMYVCAPYILSEYPEIGALEAMRNSRHLMRGQKWKMFCLDMSFFGWMLLGALALGIGIIFVLPYLHTARALFYNDISNREAAKETEFPSLDPNDYIPNGTDTEL